MNRKQLHLGWSGAGRRASRVGALALGLLLALTAAAQGKRTPLLELSRLEVSYGGIQAVKGIDLDVGEGELVCLIGANGAGKTTTLKGICGVQAVKAGTVRYAGENVTGKPPYRLVRRGLAVAASRVGIAETLLDAVAALRQPLTHGHEDELVGDVEEDEEVGGGGDDPEEVDRQAAASTLLGGQCGRGRANARCDSQKVHVVAPSSACFSRPPDG